MWEKETKNREKGNKKSKKGREQGNTK